MEEKGRYLVCRLIRAANEKYADYLELELANNWVRTRCFQLCVVVTIEIWKLYKVGEGRED